MCNRLLAAAPLLLCLLAGIANAQDVKLYRAGEAVDPRDVARILAPAAAPAMKMRSIRLLDEVAPEATQVAAAPATPQPRYAEAETRRPSALALPVQFAFDSTDILPAARAQLDALAEGIRLLPAGQAVVVEGHTDAAGGDEYNQALSQRRAQVVKRYLVAMHGIEPQRLRATGFGEYRPLPGRDLHAAEQRRVQFRGE